MTQSVTTLASRRAAPFTPPLGHPLPSSQRHICAHDGATLATHALRKGGAA